MKSQDVVMTEEAGETSRMSLASQWKRRKAALEMLIAVLEGGIGQLRSDALNLDRCAQIIVINSSYISCADPDQNK
eukprot:8194766-Pyramimonas_sp.AAC.1